MHCFSENTLCRVSPRVHLDTSLLGMSCTWGGNQRYHELYMGRKPTVPGLPEIFHKDTRDVTTFLRERHECHKAAQAAVIKLRELATKAYNNHWSQARKYAKGDFVWVQRKRGGIGNKEGVCWQGPYQVVDYISKDVYLVVGEGTGGPPGPDPLRRLPPPPSLPGFGPEVPDHGRRRRPKEILLDLVEGEKLGFCPMCLYSKYSVFLGEPNSG